MSNLTLCRVCLVGEVRMQAIRRTRYQEIYEKFTGEKLIMGNNRPDAVCFLCKSLLQKFCAFFELAQNSERYLRIVLENGTELTQLSNEGRSIHNLSISPIKYITINIKEEHDIVPVKIEPFEEMNNDDNELEDLPADTFEDSEPDPFEAVNVTVKAESNTSKHIFSCEECPRKFNSNQALNLHKTTVHKHQSCTKCSEMFANLGHLKMHMRYHNKKITPNSKDKLSKYIILKGDKYACTVCGKAFNQKGHLKCHIMSLHTSERLFECTICDRKFAVKYKLNSHMKIMHSKQKQFRCSTCNDVFNEESACRIHMASHTEECKAENELDYGEKCKTDADQKPFYCTVCCKIFQEESDLKKHMICNHGEAARRKRFSCEICNRSFGWKSHLKTHIMAIHTGERPYSCNMCEKKFVQRSSLRGHMIRTHTEPKPQTCEKCNKQCTSLSSLLIHMQFHTGEKPFACKECDKTFKRKDTLKIHIASHRGEKFPCKVCSLEFNTKAQYQSHKRLHTSTLPTFLCLRCDKKFILRSDLETHISETHSSDLNFNATEVLKQQQLIPEEKLSCDNCNKTFRVKSALIRHMVNHSADRPFACIICNKFYKRKRILKKHMEIHTEEKKFACDRCDRKFHQKGNLTNHMRIHSGEKPFVCDRCGNKFGQKNHLKTHILFMHSSERPFSCEICNKTFRLRSCLRNHQLVHTGARPFSCDRCEKKYSRKCKLKAHVAKMHT